jgi:hypothetical protein
MFNFEVAVVGSRIHPPPPPPHYIFNTYTVYCAVNVGFSSKTITGTSLVHSSLTGEQYSVQYSEAHIKRQATRQDCLPSMLGERWGQIM